MYATLAVSRDVFIKKKHLKSALFYSIIIIIIPWGHMFVCLSLMLL